MREPEPLTLEVVMAGAEVFKLDVGRADTRIKVDAPDAYAETIVTPAWLQS
jgi:hypothetical protein